MIQKLNRAQLAALHRLNSALAAAHRTDLLHLLQAGYCSNADSINDVIDATEKYLAHEGQAVTEHPDDSDDISLLLTTLADLIQGYPERELADRWREAAQRLAQRQRDEGVDDEGAWNALLA